MNTKDAIRAAILREPDEDLHRLALADWIDENEAGHVTCHICGGKGGWMSMYHGRGTPQYKTGCANCDSTGLEPDDAGFRARGIRWMVANPQNSWVCLCKGGSEVPCRCCKALGDEIKDIPKRRDGETPYVVRRGMVEEVRLAFARWYGGDCPRCDGYGLIGTNPVEVLQCSDCGGTGEIQGAGRQLVRQHPIRTLAVLDKAPRRHSGRYFMTRAAIPFRSWHVPSPLDDFRISRGIQWDEFETGHYRFKSDDHAKECLQHLMLEWARHDTE